MKHYRKVKLTKVRDHDKFINCRHLIVRYKKREFLAQENQSRDRIDQYAVNEADSELIDVE